MYFFFNDTATTEIYTLSLHDALPISEHVALRLWPPRASTAGHTPPRSAPPARRCCAPARRDRKSTRLNSSHANISYAVFCLKKKNITLTDVTSTRDHLPSSKSACAAV